MGRIKTSVIIPIYNTAEYLEECIDSVLAQTQKENEIFLVDDGSTDGSLEIIDRYAARYPFVHKLTQEHAYQGTARNRGLALAQGEYVYFMDSDDAVLPELQSLQEGKQSGDVSPVDCGDPEKAQKRLHLQNRCHLWQYHRK